MMYRTILVGVLMSTAELFCSEKAPPDKQEQSLCSRLLSCCRKTDNMDDDIVSPEQLQQMQESNPPDPTKPPPLPPQALPSPDDPGENQNRDDLDI